MGRKPNTPSLAYFKQQIEREDKNFPHQIKNLAQPPTQPHQTEDKQYNVDNTTITTTTTTSISTHTTHTPSPSPSPIEPEPEPTTITSVEAGNTPTPTPTPAIDDIVEALAPLTSTRTNYKNFRDTSDDDLRNQKLSRTTTSGDDKMRTKKLSRRTSVIKKEKVSQCKSDNTQITEVRKNLSNSLPVIYSMKQLTKTAIHLVKIYSSELTPEEIKTILSFKDELHLTHSELTALSLLLDMENNPKSADRYWKIMEINEKNNKSATPVKPDTSLLEQRLAEAEEAIFVEKSVDPNK